MSILFRTFVSRKKETTTTNKDLGTEALNTKEYENRNAKDVE